MNTTVSRDGTVIAYDCSGTGPAVILVGGALSTRSAAGPLGALLAPHFSVMAYDRRGRGDSGDTLPYSVEREIEDLQALIREAGGTANVYGMSSGAALSLAAAIHGLAIKKLAMYEPPFMVDDTRPRPPADFVEQVARLVAAGRRGDAVEAFMTQAVGVPAQNVAQMKSTPMWNSLQAIAHTVVYDLMVMGDSTIPRGAAAVQIPTLVMDGGASPAWMTNAVQAVAQAIPGAQHRTLAGQTHSVSPEMLAPVLIEFFNR